MTTPLSFEELLEKYRETPWMRQPNTEEHIRDFLAEIQARCEITDRLLRAAHAGLVPALRDALDLLYHTDTKYTADKLKALLEILDGKGTP